MLKKWYFNKKEVIDLYQKGLSCIKIAKKFGCNAETIRRRINTKQTKTQKLNNL